MKIAIQTVALAAVLMSCEKKQEMKMPVPKVKVSTVTEENIPVAIDAIGHFTAYNSAEIKAQVEGRLLKLHFSEGQFVNEGDLLYTIDPSPYQADLEKAIAEKAMNVASLQFAIERYERYRTLASDSYVSELEFHQYITDVKTLEAAVAMNIAEIELAKINLDYCYIRSPFSGVTSKRLIDKGNLIVNDGSPLLVVKQIDRIFIDFTVPERDFQRIMRHFGGKCAGLPVTFDIPDYDEKNLSATLVLVDNQIDENTGMIPLRAEIMNDDNKFWPGAFVRSKLILKHEKALLVPVSAVNIGQKGQYAYVVTKDHKLEYRSVVPGERIGQKTQIIKGLKEGETVVTEGQIRLRPGIQVEIASGEAKE